MSSFQTETNSVEHSLQPAGEAAVLRQILEGTAKEIGEGFFAALVENLAKALGTHGAWVTVWHGEKRLRAVAFWLGDRLVPDYEYDLAGTPCEPVFRDCRLVHVTDRLVELYPDDPDLKPMGAVSYIGVPLQDLDGQILGHLAVLDNRPMPQEPRLLALFRIFAARATAELQRLRAEEQLQRREERLRLLFDSAMDSVIEFNHELIITRANPAGQKAFRCDSDEMLGASFTCFLSDSSQAKLRSLMQTLGSDRNGHRSLWIPGVLEVITANGKNFFAEATLSRFMIGLEAYYTVILRNINDRLEAEEKINSLAAEAEHLRDTLKSLGGFDQVIGESGAIREVLGDVQQVAGTDATVLVLGETGTGKELIARAIHAASRRKDKPLVTVNCAAIPAALMESEFFGHEKGAFTGATQKREGCFSLADHGTIFLDEIGELSLDLQAKLLRVLQEGEFSAIGAAQVRKVDVRVIAATNRDLKAAIREGRFREDLFYRLNVFPINLPPLRKRREDIPLLAGEFAAKFSRRIGKTLEPLSEECTQRLMSYAWPGNVRELQNVIERAVITTQNGRLNLERALPISEIQLVNFSETAQAPSPSQVMTAQEFQALEHANIVRALEATNWRVAGQDGAAALLVMNPSTLNSRIKALKLRRPK